MKGFNCKASKIAPLYFLPYLPAIKPEVSNTRKLQSTMSSLSEPNLLILLSLSELFVDEGVRGGRLKLAVLSYIECWNSVIDLPTADRGKYCGVGVDRVVLLIRIPFWQHSYVLLQVLVTSITTILKSAYGLSLFFSTGKHLAHSEQSDYRILIW